MFFPPFVEVLAVPIWRACRHRTLLAPLAHAEQDPRCMRLLNLIFYAEERASRQLCDLQLALPLQGLFYEEETTSSLTQ